MSKKVRFPLVMADGAKVRTIEELREHFDLMSVLEHYSTGKLVTWLKDRYIETEAGAIQALDSGARDFQVKLCEILGVEYSGEEIDLDEMQRRRERLDRLHTFTENRDFDAYIDQVAFDQEDLADLLDEEQQQIYLCGEKFLIPVSQKGVSYVGINKPLVHLTGDIPEDMEETGIFCKGCRLDNWPEPVPASVRDFLTKASRELKIEVLTIELSVGKPQFFPLTLNGTVDELVEKLSFSCLPFFAPKDHLDSVLLRVWEAVEEKRYWKHKMTAKIDTVSAVVSGIHLDTGRKGFRTIQVDLGHPVFLDGVRYDHVPVLSAGMYEDLGLRKGSVVNVHRVGDVIPSITVLEKGDGDKLTLPEKCPHCDSKLVVKNKKLYCPFSDCKGNLAGKIMGFLDGIGMEGYGESFAESLVKDCRVKQLSQLFDLTEESFEKAGLTGKIYKKFHDELIDAVAKTPDYKVLGSIGIPDVGPARAKMLLMAYGGWNKFVEERAKADSWMVDPVRHAKAWKSLSDDAQYDMDFSSTPEMISALHNYVKTITTKFDNLRLGHTGTNPSEKVQRICKEQGIDIVDGKSFDMLLTASMDSESDKMQSARRKDIPIYTEKTFLERYGS